MPHVVTSEAARESPVFKGPVDVVFGICLAGIVADPLAVCVNVGRGGVSRGFRGSRSWFGRCRTALWNVAPANFRLANFFAAPPFFYPLRPCRNGHQSDCEKAHYPDAQGLHSNLLA